MLVRYLFPCNLQHTKQTQLSSMSSQAPTRFGYVADSAKLTVLPFHMSVFVVILVCDSTHMPRVPYLIRVAQRDRFRESGA